MLAQGQCPLAEQSAEDMERLVAGRRLGVRYLHRIAFTGAAWS